MVALVVGLLMAGVITLAPAQVQTLLGTGVALAAAASLSIRYVTRGEPEGAAPPAPVVNEMPVGVVDFGAKGE